MTWREYEALLVEFFKGEGVDVLSLGGGDKHVKVPPNQPWDDTVYVSLTRLAHRLEDTNERS